MNVSKTLEKILNFTVPETSTDNFVKYSAIVQTAGTISFLTKEVLTIIQLYLF